MGLRIIDVVPNDDYTLLLKFSNGEVKIYDMKDSLFGVFEILKDVNKFKEAFIDEHGNIAWDRDNSIDSSIHWNNRIDICKDAIYVESKIVASASEAMA